MKEQKGKVYLNNSIYVKKDSDGKFYIRLEKDNRIICSQVGYKSVESARNAYYATRSYQRKKQPKIIVYRARSCS